MSRGHVRMWLNLSRRQSNGGVSVFLKTFLFMVFGLLSYSCWYLDIAFLICLVVYSVVILRALF